MITFIFLRLMVITIVLKGADLVGNIAVNTDVDAKHAPRKVLIDDQL